MRRVHRARRLLAREPPTVVADATATRSLPVAGVDLDACQVHYSALATIADLYGVVVPSQKEIL